MSKVTPSALRGLSVAAGTVGLAAVGAAAMAGQADAAALPGVSGLVGGGLPVSTNAVPALTGAVAHNHGAIAGIPLAGLPMVGQLPGMMDSAAPVSDALPGLGHANLGELPVTRGRVAPGTERTTHVARHAPARVVPSDAPPPAAAPFRPAPAPVQAAPVPNLQTGPLDGFTDALHGLPVAGRLAGPGHSLPVVGGLSGGLPLSGLTGRLTGGLSGLDG